METNNKIPVLENIIFSKQNNYYVVHQPEFNHRVKISNELYNLIAEVDGIKTLEDVVAVYNLKYHESLSPSDVSEILYKQLGQFGIIRTDEVHIKKSEKPAYLKFSFIILPEKTVAKIVPHLTILFKKQRLLLLISVSCILLNWVFNYRLILNTRIDLLFWLYFIFLVISATLHEFGHAAATSFFKAKQGGIGIGFYMLFPVYFIDVTDIWSLQPKQRIVVNLAGVYFEFLYNALLTIVAVIIKNDFLLASAAIIPFKSLFNLFPFIRHDGYWVLTDWTDTPNFQKNANVQLLKLLKSIFGKAIFALNKKNIFLLVYAIISNLILGLFLFFMLSNIKLTLLSPYYLFIELRDVILYHKQISLGSILKFLLPSLLYVLIGKFLIKKITKNKNGK